MGGTMVATRRLVFVSGYLGLRRGQKARRCPLLIHRLPPRGRLSLLCYNESMLLMLNHHTCSDIPTTHSLKRAGERNADQQRNGLERVANCLGQLSCSASNVPRWSLRSVGGWSGAHAVGHRATP